MKKRLKYFYRDVDRNGNVRWYFKPPGSKKIRLKAAEGTREFRAECSLLLKRWENGMLALQRSTTIPVHSVEWLLRAYQNSQDFHSAADATQRQRRNFYERFCRVHGPVPFAELSAKNVEAVVSAFGQHRSAARNFLKSMRAAWKWATEQGLITENIMAEVRLPTVKTTGFKRWPIEYVLKFRDFYPKHSTPRKALACILFTAYRVSDVRLLGRRHVREDRGRHVLTVTQTKTGQPVTVPVLDLLRDELGPDYNQIIWILNAHGAPYSAKSFSQRFSKWARDAGLPPGYSAHGLRKSVGSILAELGMSEDVIMSALGHSSPAEARTYIVDVNRSKLAAQGMDKFEAEISRFWSKKFPTFEASGKVGRKKEGKSNA